MTYFESDHYQKWRAFVVSIYEPFLHSESVESINQAVLGELGVPRGIAKIVKRLLKVQDGVHSR